MTLAYSLRLKRMVLVDIVVLTLLYGIRILAGAIPLSITPSPWLFAFAMFIFLALAIVKRQQELKGVLDSGRSEAGGRAYRVEDLPVMAGPLGAASSFAAVVVLALYVQSPEVNARYGRPEFLWLICPAANLLSGDAWSCWPTAAKSMTIRSCSRCGIVRVGSLASGFWPAFAAAL